MISKSRGRGFSYLFEYSTRDFTVNKNLVTLLSVGRALGV
jgi:hypothetical protein